MSEGGDSVPDSPHESSSDHSEMHSKPPASSVPISLSTKSASPLPDSYHARLTKSISQGDGILSISEPNGWWGSRDASRPWRERMEPQRRRTIPPEQTERWERTHNRVSLVTQSILGYVIPAAHDTLEISADAFQLAPIAGLAEVARVLLTIWNSLQLVETNRLACLRLTERCADVLISVREEINEAGDRVGEELVYPLSKLSDAFKSVHILLQKQVHRPFLKRYLKRDDILRSVNACDAALSDALSLFSVSIQIRTLRILQAVEAQRKADTDCLFSTLAIKSSGDPDATPKPSAAALPPVDAPPAYSVTSSGGTGKTFDSADTKSHGSRTEGSGKSIVQSPPPTPDSAVAALKPSQIATHVPPSPEEIRTQLMDIINRQNNSDHELDIADLRSLMRAALATSSDAEMIKVLQVKREEMPEALKTLQRALEREREKDGSFEESLIEEEMETKLERADAVLVDEPILQRNSSSKSVLIGLRRRLTTDSAKSKGKLTNGSKEKYKGVVRKDSLRQSDMDTLDREFIECGIDALRRLSYDQEINLPSWTITRYEIDLEEKIGIGFFSDVYKATWRHQTVAVKVLALTTPQKLFLHEMSVWKTLNHPHVLSLLGASSARGDPPWFFVSPYMSNGNLVSYLRNIKKPIGGVMEKRMVYEVAKGMEYLHRMDVMHGDLKGTNVLIDDKGHCAITDFGQSEMKSEAFRLSGNPLPHGTLRWKAPELIGGQSNGRLTKEADVYSFAIVCVEILQHGTLPWAMIDDETVRLLVLNEDKRPVLPSDGAVKDLSTTIIACWDRDPRARPTFSQVVRDFRKKGLNKYTDSPSENGRNVLHRTVSQRRSPDMRPIPLPTVHADRVQEPPIPITESLPYRSSTLSPSTIPIQRIITPIREDKQEHESAGASPVDYRPIQVNKETTPSAQNPLSESEVQTPVHMSSSTSRSASTDIKTSSTLSESESPGVEIYRLQSPPPQDDLIAQRRNERRYRLCLQHEYHPSLTLPLWTPSHIALGAVGYLSRPSGSFVTLFNSFDPAGSSGDLADGMPSLYGYGKVAKGSQRQDRRTMTQRGLDVIQGLLLFKSKSSGTFQQNVSRRISFPLRAGHKSSYLYMETTLYQYIEDLATPKAWFRANIGRILELYGNNHRLQKEDIYLVIGALDAPDYGLFVNHNNPDGQVHFNVFAGAKIGQKWGTFSVDTELPANTAGGPVYHEDVPGKHASANKVSENRPSQPWDTLLLARLRFRPDDDRPTAL